MGEMDEGGQKVQTSTYTINTGDVMYHMVTTVNDTALHISKLLREQTLKVLTTRKNICTYDGDGC